MNRSGVSCTAAMTGGVLVLALLLPQVARARTDLQIVVDANSLLVRDGGGGLLRYRYGGVPFKPYVQELFTPAGINVLLDAPRDHQHHHALMFACAVNHVDFWGEAPTPPGGHFEPLPGRQRHLGYDDLVVTGPPAERRVRFGESLRWVVPPNDDPVLVEDRTITAERTAGPAATVLTWESRLSVPPGTESVTLSGSHYHGLGLRFIRSMDATGEFRNPDNDPGVVFRGEERLVRSRWCAYTAQADGRTVTVAMFDHPDNPRHPATWFVMAKPFAYLSATMRLHEEPLTLQAGRPLTLRYGVALWDSRPETAQIEDLCRQWITTGQDRKTP